jgi:hypothetical protein
VRNARPRPLVEGMKRIGLLLAAAATALLAGCGGTTSAPAPPGSPGNPVHAKAQPGSEGATTLDPNYRKLVEGQTRTPHSRFTPCNLVSKRQARAILGTPINEPIEAPLGPTCIYRSRDRKTFVTVAVPSLKFSDVKRQIVHKREPVKIGHRTAYCASVGRPTLYVPLSRGRVLSVVGPCPVATRFALTAVKQLD